MAQELQGTGNEGSFVVVEHTADWAITVTAPNLKQLLIAAAKGMSSLLVDSLEAVPLDKSKHIQIETYDSESLLVEWLSELAYWAETEGLVFKNFDLKTVTRTSLDAKVCGGRAEELLKHIKAVTYHDLEITWAKEGLEVTVVFDV